MNQHYWYQSLKFWAVIGQGPAGILLYMCICYVLYVYLRNVVVAFLGWVTDKGNRCCTNKKFKKLFAGPINVNEDIDEYDDVLTLLDRKFSLAEEINSRLYGMKTMIDESYKELFDLDEDVDHTGDYEINGEIVHNHEEKDKGPNKNLSGVHTYDILRNPSYI